MRKNFHLYLGKAGHLAVMSEFLTRGWDVAMPEVGVGDDIFVVQDDNGTLRRVQVKTSTDTDRKEHFSGRFTIPLAQLRNYRANFPIYYVFVIRRKNAWTPPLIIRQDYLLDYFKNGAIGLLQGSNLTLYFSYNGDEVECSGIDFSTYVADFSDFPLIEE